MANPVDAAVPGQTPGPDDLPPLPRAAAEATTVSRLLGGGDASLLIGPDATRSAAIKASEDRMLRRYRFLHFAVHASMESEQHILPGLILAKQPGDDGFLDTDDVSHLDLNADLVVLSACASGRGRIYNGEGVRGLTGSFLIAGARGVVCSLWKVNDDETARFMEAFYSRMKAGASPAQALLEQRRSAARRQSSPQWAAFILVGG
jgi:CHAT domain-containing protein